MLGLAACSVAAGKSKTAEKHISKASGILRMFMVRGVNSLESREVS